MNCDQAFELITSPTDRDDTELQHHLTGCPRCRDLAEMLAPALQFFDDGHTNSGSVSNAGLSYWSSDSLEQDASRLGNRRPQQSQFDSPEYWVDVETQQRRRSYCDGLKVAAILLLVGAFTSAIAFVGRDNTTPLARVGALDAESCLRRSEETKDSAPVLAACVACHLDDAETSKLTADAHRRVQRLVQRCVTCHLEMKQTTTEVADVGSRNHLAADETVWGHAAGPCLRLVSGG